MAGKGGYDKFFKDAQKAKGLGQGGKSAKAGARAQEPKADRSWRIAPQGKAAASETPEDRLRKELAERLSRRKQAASKKRAKFPVGPAIFAVVALVGCGAAYFNGDLVDDIYDETIGRLEIGFLGQAKAAGAEKKDEKKGKEEKAAEKKDAAAEPKAEGKEAGQEEKSAETEGKPAEKAAGANGKEKQAKVPNIKQWTPEELSFFGKLSDRKKELDQRESELAKLEEELHKRKAELDEKLKQLEAMRADISKALKTRVANDQQKVDKLVEFYSNMKPQQAAKVIETINEDLAVEVLDKMKKKNAAEIMNMMNAKKARRLSELLTGYQRSPASGGAPEMDTEGQPAAREGEES